ncbi:hypothetical protein ACHHYP_01066 [Achlya hypogyna]|uniref:Uncharacterized protein n=1 Tax=Achlya hypogyna TaxID=1202772 RepID=A0A1V9ZTT0_ACHHY|nr:hypothetical protein ACHHYP_01066 [Achlya hypogyna]
MDSQHRREEPTTLESLPPSSLFAKLPTGFWARKTKTDDVKLVDDGPLSPTPSTTSESSSAASFESTVIEADSRVHAMDDFANLVVENNATTDEALARVTKQNEFLVALLRKVTLKVTQNRSEMAAQHHRIQDLERALAKATALPAAAEMSTQTELDMEHLERLDADRETHEAMTWQLKIANAKVTSLSKCLQTERADHDAKMQEQARLIFQLEQQLNQFANVPLPPASAPRTSTALVKQPPTAPVPMESTGYLSDLHSILAGFLQQTLGVDIKSFSTKAGQMDLGMLKAHLRATTVARSTAVPPTPAPCQKHLVELDSIQDRVLAHMEAARVFLSTFALSPRGQSCDLFGEAEA